MRSTLVYSAEIRIENRFLLSATVMRAIRKLHKNSIRTEDTLNTIFVQVAEGNYGPGELPEVVPPPPIDEVLATSFGEHMLSEA